MSALLHTYLLGHVKVEVWEDNVRTFIPGCEPLVAAPNPPETMRDTIDHELMHSWIAYVDGYGPSRALAFTARHTIAPSDECEHFFHYEEEIVCSAVLGLRARRGDHRRPWDEFEVTA